MSESPALPGRHAPKGDKRQRTRARLIEAAIQLIREKGFDAVTLADVAGRVGMTTGAIYGNFKNRTDLLMAVAEVRGAPITPKLRPGMSFREVMRAIADAVVESLPQRREALPGTLAFHAYSFRNEELRLKGVAATREIYRRAGAFASFSASELPMAPELLAPVIHALVDGLTQRRLLTPELVGDEVIYAAFDALADAAAGRAARAGA
jgi:AcrR family transcriptional regulator